MNSNSMNTTTELAPAETGVFSSVESFELAQRQAKMLAQSDMVPKAFAGNVGNCVIALEVASRLKTSFFFVMQNLDVIHGKPAWKSSYLIGQFNASGKFEAITYEEDEQDGGRTRAVTRDLRTGKEITGPWVSMEMAKAEGWVGKNGSKWKTMPDLMRRYRSAAFMIRTVAPELSLGIHTLEEIVDTDGFRKAPREEAAPTENPFAQAVEAEVEVVTEGGEA